MDNDITRGIKIYLDTTRYAEGIQQLVSHTQKYASSLKQLQDAGLGNSIQAKKLESQIKRNTDTENKYRAALEQQKLVLENLGSATGNQLNSLKKFLMAQEKDAVPGTVKHTATLEQLKRVNDQLAISQQRVRGETEKQTTSFLSMSKMKASIVGFFAGIGASVSSAIYNFINTTSEFVNNSIALSAAADGVKHAFEAIDRPGLLDNLRQNTKNTLSDFNLMKAAVRADFFKIPLEKLGTLLKFAQLRAQQTGQSVDYMTESIVTGLGRKSLKILDNLGLSAAEINEEVAKTGDFMTGVSNIIERELAKSTDDYTAAAMKAAQKTAALENKMEMLGTILRPIKGQYSSLMQTMKMFFADTAIWIAEHKEMLVTITSAIVAYYSAVKIAAMWQAKYKDASIATVVVEKAKSAWMAISKGATLLYAAATALLEGNTIRATAAMRLFNMTTKLNPVGLLVGLITAGAAAFLLFKNNVSITKTAISDLNTKLDIERTSLNNVFEEMKKTNPGTSQRISLVKQLNEKYPGLISNYNLEKASLKDITLAQNEANKALVNRVATEMKAKMMNDVITNNIIKQQGAVNNIIDVMKQNMNENVFSRIEPGLRAFLSDSSKTIDDLINKYGKLFSNKNEMSKWITSLSSGLYLLRNAQTGLKGEMNAVTAIYKPYIDSLKSATNATHSLTEEEKKQQMEQSSILVKLQKQKQHVQDTWKEDSKENIVLKNKELERIDKEISKYQELGKTKRNSGSASSLVSSSIKNKHTEEINEIRRNGEEKGLLEDEINMQILSSDLIYYQKRITALEAFLRKEKDKKKVSALQAQINESHSKLIDTEINIEKQRISSLDKIRQTDLEDQDKIYKENQDVFEKSLTDKQISQDEFDVLMLALNDANNLNRLEIEEKYLNDVNSLELKNGKLKSDAVSKANEYVIAAELAASKSRAAIQEQVSNFTMDFKNENGLLTLEDETKLQLKVLEDRYKAKKELAEMGEQELTDLEKAYSDARTNITKDAEQKKASIREKYGMSSFAEQFQIQMDALNKEKQQGLISARDYAKAEKKIKIDSWKKQYDYYSNLFGSAITALQDAEVANMEAKYDVEIEAAQGNAAEVERLENEKAQKKLDIEKKYADVNFAIKASEIVANTAVAIMTALKELGPIAGPVAAALIGVTGAAQLAAANAERMKIKNMTLSGTSSSSSSSSKTRVVSNSSSSGYSEGGYTGDGGRYEVAGPVHRGEYVVPAPEMSNPRVIDSVRIIESVRRQRTGLNPLPGFAEGGYTGSPSPVSMNNSDYLGILQEILNAVQDPDNPRKCYVLLSDLNKATDLKTKAEKPFTRGDKK